MVNDDDDVDIDSFWEEDILSPWLARIIVDDELEMACLITC